MGIKESILRINPINLCRIKKLRKRLKNTDFTLFSSNCLGGLIYHELGIKFYSPTVNLRFSSKDFIRFIVNLDYYLNAEIVETKGTEPYPLGRLDDIVIHFVHYTSFDEAVSAWRRRLNRINWNNVFFILNDCDGVDEEDMRMIENANLNNVVVFSSRQVSNISCCFTLKQYLGNPCVGNTMRKSLFTGEMDIEKEFDFVSWFNQERGSIIEAYRK